MINVSRRSPGSPVRQTRALQLFSVTTALDNQTSFDSHTTHTSRSFDHFCVGSLTEAEMFSFVAQTPILAQLLDLGLLLWPGLGNKDGKLQECVHSPQSRDCWRDGFNINTDYEAHVPPGKLVEVGCPQPRHQLSKHLLTMVSMTSQSPTRSSVQMVILQTARSSTDNIPAQPSRLTGATYFVSSFFKRKTLISSSIGAYGTYQESLSTTI